MLEAACQTLFQQRWPSLNDPHVRALAWLLDAPDLLDTQAPAWAGKIATFGADCGLKVADWLLELDARPQPLHAALALQPMTRLGRYAEKLLAFYFQHQGVLVAHGLQVQAGKNQTVGEFDFLLQHAEGLVHWEFATKFYLLETSWQGDPAHNLIGPNLADTLGAKMHKILHRQLALGSHPAAQNCLPQPIVKAQALIKGWLFYPAIALSQSQRASVANNHCRGLWCRIEELQQTPMQRYVILPRLGWLAPAKVALQRGLNRLQLERQLAEYFAIDSMPVLVALVEDVSDWLIETSRVFVVPDDWQQRARQAPRVVKI